MLAVIIAAGLLMLVAFFLFSVRLLFVKGGEFRGTCAGNNPMLGKSNVVCGVCGRKPGEECATPEKQLLTYQTPV